MTTAPDLPSRHRRSPRQGADRRFRLAGDAAHRAARARGRRLLRNRAVPERRARFRRDSPQGGHSLGRPVLGHGRRARPARRRRFSTPACRCSASAMASRRIGDPAGRQGRRRTSSRIRPRRCGGRSEHSALFDGVWEKGGKYPVWMSHGDRVTKLPEGFRVIARFAKTRLSRRSRDEARRYYGVQFHLEVVHTPDGARLLSNFVHKVAGLKSDWTMAAFRGEAIAAIRRQVGDGRVLCGLSGGVDSRRRGGAHPRSDRRARSPASSSITACCGRARRKRSCGSFAITTIFRCIMSKRAELFLGALEGVDDPEVKRKTIGRLFIETFEAEAKKIAADGQRRAAISRARHALSRCHRKRLLHRRPVGDDQIAPQCRRPARAHEHAARRAACANSSRTKCARSAANSACPKLSSGAIRFPGPGLAIRCPGGITREKLDNPAQGRRRLSRRNPQGRTVRRHLAGLRRAAAGAQRRRDGRRAHLRLRRARCAR